MGISDRYTIKKGRAVKLLTDKYNNLNLNIGDIGFIAENFNKHFDKVIVDFASAFNSYCGGPIALNILEYEILPNYLEYFYAQNKLIEKNRLNTTFFIKDKLVTTQDILNHKFKQKSG